MLKRFMSGLLLLALPCVAGIRAPGPYNGIVHFDRWGGCYLYSGVYLMPISESVKNGLRRVAESPVLLSVTKVFQPINPGDGLILGYSAIAAATDTPESDEARALELELSPDFTAGATRFRVALRNVGKLALPVRADRLALTLLAKRPAGCQPFAPLPEGPSVPVVTRRTLQPVRASGEVCGVAWSWQHGEALPYIRTLPAGTSHEFAVTFHLSPGEYEGFLGYGGGVHAERATMSNTVPFNVSDSGEPRLAPPPNPSSHRTAYGGR